jgi:hypothetical protein
VVSDVTFREGVTSPLSQSVVSDREGGEGWRECRAPPFSFVSWCVPFHNTVKRLGGRSGTNQVDTYHGHHRISLGA